MEYAAYAYRSSVDFYFHCNLVEWGEGQIALLCSVVRGAADFWVPPNSIHGLGFG